MHHHETGATLLVACCSLLIRVETVLIDPASRKPLSAPAETASCPSNFPVTAEVGIAKRLSRTRM